MSQINTGGHAFPVGFQQGESIAMKGGMTLRDYFAAKALPMAFAASGTAEQTAERAYKLADAMIAAREKGGSS